MRRPSHATIVAYLALFVALAGSSYAAIKLPRNSVGTKQLRKNAVTSAKVKNGTLSKSDFKKGLLLQGPKGDKGDKGDQGAPGTARASGLITPSCTGSAGAEVCTVDKNHGIAQVVRIAAGDYCIKVNGVSGPDTAAVASINFTVTSNPETQKAALVTRTGGGCPNPDDFQVITKLTTDNSNTNLAGFQLIVP